MSKWRRKSDRPVVPAKLTNKANEDFSNAAELVEGRSLAKGNRISKTYTGHSAGQV